MVIERKKDVNKLEILSLRREYCNFLSFCIYYLQISVNVKKKRNKNTTQNDDKIVQEDKNNSLTRKIIILLIKNKRKTPLKINLKDKNICLFEKKTDKTKHVLNS